MNWKAITGWEGKYAVSTCGKVRNVRTNRVLQPMRTGTKRNGAQRSKVRLSTVPRIDRDVAHLVLEAFVGPRPSGAVAMHANDDSSDNRVANLRWGTPSENTRESVHKGRRATQVMTATAVATVRDMRAHGVPGKAVAALFGISQQRVCDLIKGRTIF